MYFSEEAVEMLNRSDTPETRALLSQAGIQISDEIADSEEEEQVIEKSPTSDLQVSTMPITVCITTRVGNVIKLKTYVL